MNADRFFRFARARHQIFLDRTAGKPPPWTDDPVLATTRFTNVFRELDRTTLWFRQNIREPLRDEFWVVPATIIFRWFNRIETGECLMPPQVGLLQGEFRRHQFEGIVRDHLPRGPWVTGSYMVCSGRSTGDKLSGILRYCELMLEWWQTEGRKFFLTRPNLQAAHTKLLELEGLAGFTAYEVVTDLRWTWSVDPTDRNRWAHAGPGATRGGSRVLHGEPDRLSQSSAMDQVTLVNLMDKLLRMSRNPRYWPQSDPNWPLWEMREVEHTLCEFDKYERVRRCQGRAKNKFAPERAKPLLWSGYEGGLDRGLTTPN